MMIDACIYLNLGIATYASPQQSTSYDFYIGALRNYRGHTTDIWLYIMTRSSSPVNYTVETYSGTIATGIVTNTTLSKLAISTTLVVLDSSYQNRNKGIHVSSNNEISVLLINYQIATIGEYLAYPVQNLSIPRYRYYAVSTGTLAISEQSLSEVLLVGTEDNTAVTVVPTQNITVPQNTQFSSSPEINVTAGTPFSFTLHKLQTFLFGAPGNNDITGTSILSDKSLTVISGHECGNVPDDVYYCEHITEQIPPTVNWGQQFLLTPYSGRPVQYYKIVTASNHTTYNFTCGINNTTTYYLQTAGSSSTHSTGSNNYCSISSDKQILVTQLVPGHALGNTGDPAISLVPSIDQYSQDVVFVFPNLTYGTPYDITSHYINIATTNQNTILLDGVPLSLTWNAIYDYTNNVIGYGTQLNSTSLDIPHILASDNKFTTLIYGVGSSTAYSYSAGLSNMQSIFLFHYVWLGILCVPECVQGICIGPNVCQCYPGWNGASCNTGFTNNSDIDK